MSRKIEVILVEGIDLAGKTHLWNALMKAFPGIGIKLTDRPLDNSDKERKKIKEYYRAVLGFININYQNKTFIMDRFFPSEMVYSAKRGYEAMRDPDLLDCERVLHHRKHLVLYCDPGIDTIIERLKVRGDDYVNEGDLRGLYDRYERFFKQTSLNYLRLDTKLPVEKLIEQIKEAIGEPIEKPQPTLFDNLK